MDHETKKSHLRRAEVFDAWRVFPRTFLTVAFAGYCWLMLESWHWYKTIDFVAIDWANLTALTAFPLGLLTGLGAMLRSMYIHYQESGRDWSKPVLNGNRDAPKE